MGQMGNHQWNYEKMEVRWRMRMELQWKWQRRDRRSLLTWALLSLLNHNHIGEFPVLRKFKDLGQHVVSPLVKLSKRKHLLELPDKLEHFLFWFWREKKKRETDGKIKPHSLTLRPTKPRKEKGKGTKKNERKKEGRMRFHTPEASLPVVMSILGCLPLK